MGFVFAIATAILFAISNLLARKGVEDVGVDKITGLLFTVLVNAILSTFVVIIIAFFGSFVQFSLKGFIYMILGGLFSSFIGRALLFFAVEKIGSSRMSSIKMTNYMFTVILAVFFLNEIISPLNWLGIGIVFTGLFVVSSDTKKTLGEVNCNLITNNDNLHLINKNITQGIILAVLCGLAYSFSNIFRKLAIVYYPSPILGLAVGSWAALIGISIFEIARARSFNFIKANIPSILKGGYFRVGLTTGLAQLSLLYAFIYLPAALVSSVAATESLFTVYFCYLLLREKEYLNIRTVIGALIITLGVILVIIT